MVGCKRGGEVVKLFFLVGLYMEIRGIRDGSRRDGVWRVMGAIHILFISDDYGWDDKEHDRSSLYMRYWV